MKNLFIFLFLFFTAATIFTPTVACAYDFNTGSGINDLAKGSGHLDIKLSKMTLTDIIGFIINIILSFAGIIFLILIIYAGYTWLMARDNPSEATKSRTIIKNAILGLILVASAYAITYFITNAIGTSTGLTK